VAALALAALAAPAVAQEPAAPLEAHPPFPGASGLPADAAFVDTLRADGGTTESWTTPATVADVEVELEGRGAELGARDEPAADEELREAVDGADDVRMSALVHATGSDLETTGFRAAFDRGFATGRPQSATLAVGSVPDPLTGSSMRVEVQRPYFDVVELRWVGDATRIRVRRTPPPPPGDAP